MMEMAEIEEAEPAPPAAVHMEPAVTAAGTTASSAGSQEESAGGWGWGGWRTSAFSVLNEIQKAASEAAEEIQKNVRICHRAILDDYLFLW
jgi:hypothetical protein